MKWIITLLIVLAQLICVAQTVDELIAKHIVAIGGNDAWKSITTYTINGTATMLMQDVKVVMYKKNVKVRQEISLMGIRMTTGYNGALAWIINPLSGTDSATVLNETESALLAKNNNLEDAFLDYTTRGYTALLQGKEEVANESCYVILLTKEKQPTEKYYINAFTLLLIKAELTVMVNNKPEVTTFSYFNYKKVGNVLMPHTISLPLGEMKITTVTFNAPLTDAMFDVPNSK